MSELLVALVAALPALAALGLIGTRSTPLLGRAWRGTPRPAKLAAFALAIAACHPSCNDYARGPVPQATLPFGEPVAYASGPNSGRRVPTQNGLLASYFAGTNYDRLDHQRIDPNVDFTWDATGQNPVIPDATVANHGLDENHGFSEVGPPIWGIWSVVWEGYLEAPADGPYTLGVHANNGGWLEMKRAAGGLETVVANPGGPSFEGTVTATRTLAAGRHYLRLSYYQSGAPSGVARLLWQPPGAAELSVIPASALFTQAAPAARNTAPVVDIGTDAKAYVKTGFERVGRFTDPDPGQSWAASVDFGDGSGQRSLALREDGSFDLRHLYAAPGTYRVSVTVTDSDGASGHASISLTVDLLRAIVYVHGTTGRFNGDIDFPILLEPLRRRYELIRYQYYEDRGNADPASSALICLPDGQRTLPAFDASVFTAAGLVPDAPDPAPGVCDSNDSIELNAVLLAADVAEFATRFDRVTLISNSGGAAMVRAFLAYAAVADPAAVALVDLAVFLEGVQAGSYLAANVAGIQAIDRRNAIGIFVRDRTLDALKPIIFHDPRRPVFDDVLPLHALQRYVARREAVPDGPHYLNVAGDLNITIARQLLWWQIRRDIYPAGDLVMLPGSDEPTALPPNGGARFLPSEIGAGRSSAQWVLRRDFYFVIDTFTAGGDASGSLLLTGLTFVAKDPAAHHNLSRMSEICVQTPRGVRRLHESLFEAVVSLDQGALDRDRLGFGSMDRTTCP